MTLNYSVRSGTYGITEKDLYNNKFDPDTEGTYSFKPTHRWERFRRVIEILTPVLRGPKRIFVDFMSEDPNYIYEAFLDDPYITKVRIAVKQNSTYITVDRIGFSQATEIRHYDYALPATILNAVFTDEN